MHKLIMWFFNNLNNIGQTVRMICSFFIMATIVYWFENIFNAQWNWLDFLKPILDTILNFANSILPFAINLGDTVLDGKFIVAMILLISLMFILNILIESIQNLQYYYDRMHDSHKKNVEQQFNKNMKNKVISEELQIVNYMVLIKTRLQKKFTNSRDKFNIQKENNLMNRFIFKKTNKEFELYNDGFLYKFDDFNEIDKVLDALFKIMASPSPLEYSICIQSGDNIKQLDKLAKLEYFDKIIFCADTLLRYKCNKSHRYGTLNVGIFQQDEGTIEVHEFHKIL